MNVEQRHNIYVLLVNEPTEIWRPVEGVARGEHVYQIVSENSDPEGQTWQFVTGDTVRCELHTFMDGAKGWVAVEKVDGKD